MLIRKKEISEVDVSKLREPRLIGKEITLLERGILLFNEGRFWEAHEVWEELWKRRSEESRIFFQGIIQAAAGFHRMMEKPLLNGAVKNLDKALAKLKLFPSEFLGIDVEALRTTIMEAQKTLASRGLPGQNDGLQNGRPRITFRGTRVY